MIQLTHLIANLALVALRASSGRGLDGLRDNQGRVRAPGAVGGGGGPAQASRAGGPDIVDAPYTPTPSSAAASVAPAAATAADAVAVPLKVVIQSMVQPIVRH